jgi:hypothetical protein
MMLVHLPALDVGKAGIKRRLVKQIALPVLLVNLQQVPPKLRRALAKFARLVTMCPVQGNLHAVHALLDDT